MKTFTFLSLFILFFNLPSFSQPDKEEIKGCITRFFDGLSEMDFNKIREHTTTDFILLEDGEVWNADTLISKLSLARTLDVRRVNKFVFIDIQQQGDIAWVSYHNTAEFSFGDKQKTVNWLESAVLKKTKDQWKIQLLHSTPVPATKPD